VKKAVARAVPCVMHAMAALVPPTLADTTLTAVVALARCARLPWLLLGQLPSRFCDVARLFLWHTLYIDNLKY
jgi:hypothetical protein